MLFRFALACGSPCDPVLIIDGCAGRSGSVDRASHLGGHPPTQTPARAGAARMLCESLPWLIAFAA